MSASTNTTSRLTGWVKQQEQTYGRDDGALGGYVALMSTYVGGTAAALLAARRLKKAAPDQLTPWQLAQLAVATHKIARTLAKDPVTSPLRAPFTTFGGASAPGELTEKVRGTGLQHAAGELVTCPMCLSQWVATGLLAGLSLSPALTRLVIEVFAAVAGADFLQHAYVRLQQATE